MSTVNSVFNKFNPIAPSYGAAIMMPSHNRGVSYKKKLNVHALAGSAIGTGMSLALIFNSNKSSDKLFKKLVSTSFASPKKILTLGVGSILGGFTGGVIKDKKKHLWQKVREMNFQLISNVVSPLLFLSAFKKINKQVTKNSTKTIKAVSNFAAVVGGVLTGVVSGSVVANKINENFIKPDIPYRRKLGVKDFLVHVDDLPTALAFSDVPYVDKLVPFILVSRGYEVGKQ